MWDCSEASRQVAMVSDGEKSVKLQALRINRDGFV